MSSEELARSLKAAQVRGFDVAEGLVNRYLSEFLVNSKFPISKSSIRDLHAALLDALRDARP